MRICEVYRSVVKIETKKKPIEMQNCKGHGSQKDKFYTFR